MIFNVSITIFTVHSLMDYIDYIDYIALYKKVFTSVQFYIFNKPYNNNLYCTENFLIACRPSDELQIDCILTVTAMFLSVYYYQFVAVEYNEYSQRGPTTLQLSY